MTSSIHGPALRFEILATCSISRARASRLVMPHGPVDAPVFMPVGTQGTLKGITPTQLMDLGCQIMLANTYHLGHRPGEELLRKAGGLHNWMGWPRCLLTDSGGFQMVSLLKLSRVEEEGVCFSSPRDGSPMMLSPEKSMQLQQAIGADIVMQLDDVVPTLLQGPRVEEALDRTLRWLDRCRKELGEEDRTSSGLCVEEEEELKGQNLFPIVQGGTDLELRTRCIEAMLPPVRPLAPGYAIGGLSGGEDKSLFWRTVSHCCTLLPRDRPIYCMGVGYAVDLIVCVALGVDMFDCVYPTRTARFGTALTPDGLMQLRNSRYECDFRPIQEDCICPCCKKYSRAMLHSMVTRETVACHLVTLHNVHYQLQLMRSLREAIQQSTFPEVASNLLQRLHANETEGIPVWVREAMSSVGIILK